MALPILAAAKMAKAAPGKVDKYLRSESSVTPGITKGQRAWNWTLIIGGAVGFIAVMILVYWATGGFEKRNVREKFVRPSRVMPRKVSASEHMFDRGNDNHRYTGPEKSMLIPDTSDFQGYYGVNPDGFGETREKMTKARYRVVDKTPSSMIDPSMLEEDEFTEQLKADEKLERRQNRNTKTIKQNSYNTGHIEQTNELEAAAELSSGNDFTQKFAMNSAKGSNVRAYIKPLEKQSTTAHILNFAEIRK